VSFFGELNRRNVIRVGIAYAIAAWVIIQVADVVLENIAAPAWVIQSIMLLLGLGLPVALIFSWAYEVTPEGVKRESEIDRTASITGVTGHRLDRAIIVLLVIALGYFVWESRIATRSNDVPANAIVQQDESAELSIAVLPFENRSNLTEDEFFTEGMHDDLLTTLAKIGSMKVISRTSVMEYKDTTKKIPEIARELGVNNILEGGVQRSGNQVRINMQLIDAQTDEHLWAEIYDRELTAENLFAIQSEISAAIAQALRTALSSDEQRRISTAPTDNLQAYDAYWRGRPLMDTREAGKLEQAAAYFEQAVELDPQFALAWVGIADAYSHLSSYGSMTTAQTLDVRQDAVDKALAINPDLGEAYASLGSLEQSRNRYDEAEAAYRTAIEKSPNYAPAYQWLSFLLAIAEETIDEGIELARRAAEIDPHSTVVLVNLAQLYRYKGAYDDATREIDNALSFDPGFVYGHVVRADIYRMTGRLDESLESIKTAVELDPKSPYQHLLLVERYLALGAVDAAYKALREMSAAVGRHFFVRLARIQIGIDAGNEGDVYPLIQSALDKPGYNRSTQMALIALLKFQDMQGIGQVTAKLEPQFSPAALRGIGSDDPSAACLFAWMLQQSGFEEKSELLLETALHRLENELPQLVEHVDRLGGQLCYLTAGRTDEALDLIEQQFEHGHFANWPTGHTYPVYDAIREHPRYLAVRSQYEQRLAELREAAGL
jgi:TolB-like protein/Tfp pilus assembly protein PilF